MSHGRETYQSMLSASLPADSCFFMDKTKQKLDALENFIKLMKDDRDLPRDLQIILEELHDYIVRNK